MCVVCVCVVCVWCVVFVVCVVCVVCTHTEKNRKKKVEVVLVDADIIKLKYEVAYLDETGNSRGLNHLIRQLRRVDLNYMPVRIALTI